MKILIPVIVGAIIGYVTNWLAIKMLFSPLKEKRIFGIKLPFTPGLIPKEKSRIARSVGETIGKHLLSPEVIVRALCSEKISSQIYSYIEDNINKYSKKEYRVKDLLEQFFNSHYDSFRNKFQYIIYNSLYVQLVDTGKRNKIVKALNQWILIKYNEFVKTQEYLNLKEKLSDNLSGYLKSGDAKGKVLLVIENYINKLMRDDRTFSQVIPSEVLDEIKMYVFNHSQDISDVLKDLLKSAPLRERLKFTTADMFQQTFGSFVSKLINPELVSEKIINAIQKYLENPDNYNNIAAIANRTIESILENKISEFASSISEETKKNTSENITNAVISYINNKEKRTKIIDELENEVKKVNLGGLLDTIIESTLQNDANTDNSDNSLKELVENIIEAVENINLSSVLSTVDDDTIKSLGKIFTSAFEGFVKNKAGDIIELINIPEIVENEINGFDIEFAEKIIIDISRKELSAITWLGALLGGVMGLLTPLMQLLYK